MKKTGRISLILITILVSFLQYMGGRDLFFNFELFLFIFIAWLVGWQYDKVQFQSKQAQASEETYKHLINILPEAIIIHQDDKVVYTNKAAIALLGGSGSEKLIGDSIFNYVAPESKDRVKNRIEQIQKDRSPLDSTVHKLKRMDGTMAFFEVASMYVTFGQKEAVLSIGRDITEQKERTEKLLQKSENLALLGKMAAGIAHEIRNPLTSIKGFMQLFKSNSNYIKGEYYDVVLSEIERINLIVSEFLFLSKPSADVFSEKDIKILLNDIEKFIGSQSIMSNVQVFLEFNVDFSIIRCEENRLKQVFLNLLKNAIEAMPKGGDIYIKVIQKENSDVTIQIIDQGTGIPEERISSLGEPFYSTKEKGTGLGLMICFKIIEDHNGKLKIQSKVDEGTTVEITLPIISNDFKAIKDVMN
ncbi:ATP-binding protein [Bacillus solitudinis]|uniref:ATP-binding protein n=1 Tax=Bacillus solitudinis TaxID=2014074 RepID=UPI000C24C81E|nr:ATP-binding protein [Bacillus solitudinis]